jgi:hypothetical protein
MSVTTDWLQVGLLAVNAGFFYKYLRETKLMREAAEKQVAKSQDLVETAQKQVAAAQKQLEAQIRPAVAVRIYGGLRLANVGSGPALNLRMHALARDAPVEIIWAGNSTFAQNLEGSFICAQQGQIPPDQLLDTRAGADFFGGDQRQILQIVYQSLSGKDYASIVEFDVHGQPLITRFVER